MSKVKITFESNEETGKREIHIDYESDASSLPFEHEDEHRRVVGRVLDVKDLESDGESEITREEPSEPPPRRREEPKVQRRARRRLQKKDR